MNKLALFVFGVILVSTSLALNYTNYTGGPWHFSVASLFSDKGVSRHIAYDSKEGYVLVVNTSDSFDGVWRLWKVIPHPPADDFYVEFKVWEYAPGIDLDLGNTAGNTAGEAVANDGPNIFSFIYYSTGKETNYTSPGFDPNSISWSPFDGYMCHMHVECNYLGDNENYIYCLSKTTYKGWFFDGAHLGDNKAINKYDSEPIQQQTWHDVVLHIRAGQCLNDNLTLVVMGADPFKNRAYEWKITGFRIYTTENQSFSYNLPLNVIYDDNANKTLKAPTFCGDGIKEDPNSYGQYEQCDGNDGVPKGYRCTSNCTLAPICGDNVKEPGEVCDGTDTPKGYKCAPDCKSMTPICGDGIVVKGEQCDDKAPVKPGYICIHCHLLKDEGIAYKIVDMAETMKIPNNGTRILNITVNKPMSFTAKDVAEYISVKGYKIPIKICTHSVCGNKYLPDNGVLNLTSGLNNLVILNKNGTYYLGIKRIAPSILPILAIALVAIILVLVVLVVLVYLLVFSRSGQNRKKPKRHIKVLKKKKNRIRLR